MDIQRILSTELRLLEPICEFSDHGDYVVYRSDTFRNYYGGNGIDIHVPGDKALADWETTFHRFFDPSQFEHITFTFPHREDFARLIEQAKDARYHVTYDTYMFVDTTEHCAPMPEGLEIHKLSSEDDWQRLGEFYSQSYEDGDWYDPDATGPDRLFEKTRFTSEAIGIDWYYLTRTGEREILASLGIFEHQGICRLQAVETDRNHRRQGLATALVSFAIEEAIDRRGTAGLALCADSDYYAVDLYRKLGFVERGAGVCLMHYPIRNPAYMEPSPND